MRHANSLTIISRALVVIAMLVASACGGGGGSSSGSISPGEVTPQDGPSAAGTMMSFEKDIEPIMQAKCLGCHNSGGTPLAPFSLEGIDQVNSFRSAIQFVLESHTMPPIGALQLTSSEHAKIKAWLSDQPYVYAAETLRIRAGGAVGLGCTTQEPDAFPDHRPADVDCPRETGWLVEEDAVEVRTEFCDYLSISQQALLDLDSGTNLELAIRHSTLSFETPATAHVAVSVAGHHHLGNHRRYSQRQRHHQGNTGTAGCDALAAILLKCICITIATTRAKFTPWMH